MAARKRQRIDNVLEPAQQCRLIEANNLPDDLIEAIAAFLPPDEITKLSILSKRFKYTWRSCRNFSFDSNISKKFTRPNYIKVVNHFFKYHVTQNIDRFKLFFDPINEKDLVCSWIAKCVELGIKELELNFLPSSGTYVLGSNLLTVVTLKILRLINCELDLSNISPSNFFSNLSELRFQYHKPKPATIQAIFANCLLLRTFEIMDCNNMYYLNISAPNQKDFKELVIKHCADIRSIRINAPTLNVLHYHGKICEFLFYCHFPKLEDVIFEITAPRGFQMFPHKEDLFVAIRNVHTLTVTSPFLEMLSLRFEEGRYRELEFYLMNLKEFHLIVQPESFLNPFDIAMFMKKCPNVERVFIDLGPNSFASSLFWDYHGRASLGQFRTIFPFVKTVKIKGFTLKELHVTLARFFLKFAKNLECLVLVKARNYNFPQIFAPECIRWEIESGAHIEVYEHFRDISTIVPKHFKKV